MPCDGVTFAVGQTENALRPCSSNVAVDEAVHVRQPSEAGIMAHKSAETLAVPVIAEEIVQERCPHDRRGLLLGKMERARNAVSGARDRKRVVVDRVCRSVVLKGAQLLKTRIVQDTARISFNFVRDHRKHLLKNGNTGPFLTLLYARNAEKSRGRI